MLHNGEFGRTTDIGGMDLAPDGKTAYFATFRVKHNKPAGRNWQLRAIDLATGQTGLIRTFPGAQGTEAAATADPTGPARRVRPTRRRDTGWRGSTSRPDGLPS